MKNAQNFYVHVDTNLICTAIYNNQNKSSYRSNKAL